MNPAGGEGLAISPDGRFLFAAGSSGAVIDTKTLQIVKPIQSAGPIDIH